MTIPFRESFGEDDCFEDEREFTVGYREGENRPLDTIGYNPVTKSWECTCRMFQVKGSCGHSYRFKRQVTVIVREEYL